MGKGLLMSKGRGRGQDQIKIQVTHRLDDRVTATVKLIGWKAEMLATIEHQPFMQTLIARRLRDAVVDTFKNVN